nr:hypothetical protein [Candidatus Sigynarchaeota archaeon]
MSYSTYTTYQCMECNASITYFSAVRKCRKCGMDLCLKCSKKRYGLCIWCYQHVPAQYLRIKKIATIGMILALAIPFFLPAPMPLVLLIPSNPVLIGYLILFLLVGLIIMGSMRASAAKKMISAIPASAEADDLRAAGTAASTTSTKPQLDFVTPVEPASSAAGREVPFAAPAATAGPVFESAPAASAGPTFESASATGLTFESAPDAATEPVVEPAPIQEETNPAVLSADADSAPASEASPAQPEKSVEWLDNQLTQDINAPEAQPADQVFDTAPAAAPSAGFDVSDGMITCPNCQYKFSGSICPACGFRVQ